MQSSVTEFLKPRVVKVQPVAPRQARVVEAATHLLLHLGYRRQTVVVAIYGTVAGFCVFAAATVLTKSWALAVALVLVEFVAVLALRLLGLRPGNRFLPKAASGL